MQTKIDLYRIFYEVAKRGSFSKAKDTLFMSQPAISQAIKQLEETLNQRLFNRVSRGVNLTVEGKVLFSYIEDAMHLIDTGEKKLRAYKELQEGELIIGVGDTISKYYLLPYLNTFHVKYPKMTFRIVNGTTLELLPLLKVGEIDVAICNLPVEDEKVTTEVLLEVNDIFVAGEAYREKFKHPVSLEELNRYPLIVLEKKSNSRRFVENQFLKAGLELEPAFELGSYDLLVEFAKINFGIAAIVRQFSEAELKAGKLFEVPLKEPLMRRAIGACFKKNIELSEAGRAFVEILKLHK